MTTSGVDGIGGVGDGGPDEKKLDRAAGADDSGKADGVDGTGKADDADGSGPVDGSGGAESLGDDFKPLDGDGGQHARLMGQIHEMGPQQVSPGSELERIQEQGYSRADEARIQQLLDRLMDENF